MKIELKTITGELIFSGDFTSLAECVKAALADKKSLSAAYHNKIQINMSKEYINDWRPETRLLIKALAKLSSANLSGANLSSANLSGADLSSANLSGADLSSAFAGYAVNRANNTEG